MKKLVLLLSLAAFLAVSCAKKEQEPQVSFTPCQQTKATKSELADTVDVKFTNEGVKITHYNFEVTCDFTTVNVTHTFVNGVLRITQQGFPTKADCKCYTDVSYTINGLLQEDVNVIFINGEQVYCYNEEDANGVITMTTMASEASISVRIPKATGSDNFTIDWGDDEKSNMDDISFYESNPNSDFDWFSFGHKYSSASEHRITITGDNIQYLECSWNSLTSLDVSRYSALQVLYCRGNQLIALDLSKNTALESVYCTDNSFTNLNVVSNSLTFLDIRYCQLLTTLDVGKSTALRSLHVNNSQLTALDVSKNSALEVLYCYDNHQLTSIDVKNNTVLFRISCDGNQLTASALNDLFSSLPDWSGSGRWGNIDIKNNPGTSDCDFTIATGKGWIHWTSGMKSFEVEDHEELYLNFIKNLKNL